MAGTASTRGRSSMRPATVHPRPAGSRCVETACSTRRPRPATTATSMGGDGCSPDCKTETDWICPTPGQPVPRTPSRCGDGMIAGAETCDDRNTLPADGCDASCQLEPGWTCPQAGARCVPRCGDGIKLGFEQCDDGNAIAGGRLQRRLSRRAGLRLPDARSSLPPDDVRRQREGGQRGLRRRQHVRRRRLRRRLPRRTGLRRERPAAPPRAATGSSCRAKPATTATPSPATAVRPPARSSRAGTAAT